MGQTAKPPLGLWGPWGLQSDHMPSAAVTQSLTEGVPICCRTPPGPLSFHGGVTGQMTSAWVKPRAWAAWGSKPQ